MKIKKNLAGILTLLLLSGLTAFAENSENNGGITGGYEEGIFLKTADDNFKLKLRTRLQFLAEEDITDLNGEKSSSGTFSIRRARIELEGNAFYPWLQFKNQLTLEGGTVSLRDFYIKAKYLKVIYPQIGQFKVPFNREFLTSSSVLQFVDRSIVSEEYSVQRDVGLSINGAISLFNYSIGVFNGSGKNSTNQDRDLMYTARFVLVPLGKKDEYTPPDIKCSEQPWLAVGAGVAFLPGYEPDLENKNERKHLSDVAREYAGQDGSVNNVIEFTADIAGKYRGFSLEGDYTWREIDPKTPSTSPLKSNGIRVQAGYMILKDLLDAGVRYALVTPDTTVRKNNEQEITAGLNYYISGHDLKCQFDYSYINNKPLSEIENKIRLQFQLYF
jgi:phosphate-selective porin OprO/OprP